jgi:hypothetical protein
VRLWRNGRREAEEFPLDAATPDRYLEAFLGEINGAPLEGELTTGAVIRAAQAALVAQAAADGRTDRAPITYLM